jgi:hypothetical protein
MGVDDGIVILDHKESNHSRYRAEYPMDFLETYIQPSSRFHHIHKKQYDYNV